MIAGLRGAGHRGHLHLAPAGEVRRLRPRDRACATAGWGELTAPRIITHDTMVR
jgi:hypothetical protein